MTSLGDCATTHTIKVDPEATDAIGYAGSRAHTLARADRLRTEGHATEAGELVRLVSAVDAFVDGACPYWCADDHSDQANDGFHRGHWPDTAAWAIPYRTPTDDGASFVDQIKIGSPHGDDIYVDAGDAMALVNQIIAAYVMVQS